MPVLPGVGSVYTHPSPRLIIFIIQYIWPCPLRPLDSMVRIKYPHHKYSKFFNKFNKVFRLEFPTRLNFLFCEIKPFCTNNSLYICFTLRILNKMFLHVDVSPYIKTRIPSFSVVMFFKYDVKAVYVTQRWASKPFLSQQIANPQILGSFRYRKSACSLGVPVRKSPIFMIIPQIENPPISTNFCPTLSHISP